MKRYIKVPVEIEIEGYEIPIDIIEDILKKINLNQKIDKFEVNIRIIEPEKWDFSPKLVI